MLILPLCVPVLIFGVAAAGGGGSDRTAFAPPFLILCALSLLALVGAPVAAAAALRQMSQ